MAKYSKALVVKIVTMIEEDKFTITDICRILSVSTKSYYGWRADKPEFAKAVALAMENREERLKMMARKAIKKKLEGYAMVETKTVYAVGKNAEEEPELKVKEYVVKDKYCVPETSAIALGLQNGLRGGQKAKGAQETKMPLSIVVGSDKAKRDLELLRENLNRENEGCKGENGCKKVAHWI